MNEHVDALFQLTRQRITERHISDFSPADPGYESYVRLWTRILRSGAIPNQSEFDLSEVIGLTGWAAPTDFDEPDRFQQYRRFTSSVAVALINGGNDSECVRVANYLARDLIVDTDIGDREHFVAVRNVLPVVRDSLLETNFEEEYPFFTFGSLILAQMAGDFAQMPSLASQLIDDDAAVRTNDSLNWSIQDSRFLFGLTNYNQLNADWVALSSLLSNPTNDTNIQLVMNTFTEYAT